MLFAFGLIVLLCFIWLIFWFIVDLRLVILILSLGWFYDLRVFGLFLLICLLAFAYLNWLPLLVILLDDISIGFMCCLLICVIFFVFCVLLWLFGFWLNFVCFVYCCFSFGFSVVVLLLVICDFPVCWILMFLGFAFLWFCFRLFLFEDLV